jgi:L-alanine-DL-glutamate epimerase-like enolase superfamily enzyme
VIVTEIHTDDGGAGHGFSWTPTIGPQAVKALLDYDIAPFISGLPANPEVVWDALWKRLHEAGGGGLTTIAMAGVDLALWDLQASRAGTSVTGFVGQRQESAEVYGSGVNLHYSLEELVAQTERWIAAGHQAVKIKVGKPDIREDAERVAAVRSVLGPDRKLMIDANQRWDLPTTLRALDVLAGSAWNGSRNPSGRTISGPTGGSASTRRCRSPSVKTSTPSTASAISLRRKPWTSSSRTSSGWEASPRSGASLNLPGPTASR